VITEQFDSTLPLFEKTTRYSVHRIPNATNSKLGIWLWMIRHMHLFLQADIIHMMCFGGRFH
jgi:hypothetical protein